MCVCNKIDIFSSFLFSSHISDFSTIHIIIVYMCICMHLNFLFSILILRKISRIAAAFYCRLPEHSIGIAVSLCIIFVSANKNASNNKQFTSNFSLSLLSLTSICHPIRKKILFQWQPLLII